MAGIFLAFSHFAVTSGIFVPIWMCVHVLSCLDMFCSLISIYLSQHLFPGLYYVQARPVCC